VLKELIHGRTGVYEVGGTKLHPCFSLEVSSATPKPGPSHRIKGSKMDQTNNKVEERGGTKYVSES